MQYWGMTLTMVKCWVALVRSERELKRNHTDMSLGSLPNSRLFLPHGFPDSLHLLLVSCPVPLRAFLGLFQSLLQ